MLTWTANWTIQKEGTLNVYLFLARKPGACPLIFTRPYSNSSRNH